MESTHRHFLGLVVLLAVFLCGSGSLAQVLGEDIDACGKASSSKVSTCKHQDFKSCKALAGDPANVFIEDFIYQGKPIIQIYWDKPLNGYSNLWGYEVGMIGKYNDANHYDCFQLNEKDRTYWTFVDIVYGAEYDIKLRSLPSNSMITRTFRTREKCQHSEFKSEPVCCAIVNLNARVFVEEGKIQLSWNIRCANKTSLLKKFLVRWTNIQIPHKCLGISETSEMNYTIQLGPECRRYNYSIKVYGVDERQEKTKSAAKVVNFPKKNEQILAKSAFR